MKLSEQKWERDDQDWVMRSGTNQGIAEAHGMDAIEQRQIANAIATLPDAARALLRFVAVDGHLVGCTNRADDAKCYDGCRETRATLRAMGELP